MARRKLLALLVPVLFFAAGCTDRESATPTAPEAVAFVNSSCSLGVSDAAALAAIAALIIDVDALETAGSLTAEHATALRNHLSNAANQVSAGNYCPAIAQLDAFVRQVGNFVNTGALTPEEAEPLTEDATVVLDGPPPPPQVTVDPPSSAAGVYAAAAAEFGPPLTVGGVAGNLVLVNDGVTADIPGGSTADGCTPLGGFPAGAIAIVLRSSCNFTVKVKNAQDAGAVAVIVVNNVAGPAPGLGGSDPTISIPSVGISQADGATILVGLPATGKVSRTP